MFQRKHYCWKPKKEKIVFGIDDVIISFFVGIVVCLYLM